MIENELSELSEFMQYLARERADGDRLPSLVQLSSALGVSIASLREQLEVARALGLVEVRPKKGIRRLPYTFAPAVLKSLSYAASVDPAFYFDAYADLRMHVEAAYWHKAVSLLTDKDQDHLRDLVAQAFEKLRGEPIQIPHSEHRELHLSIFCRLNNPFVTGILEAYWEAYEAVGLNRYTDFHYLVMVWEYHRKMVEAVCSGDYSAGYQALIEHTNLLQQRNAPAPRASASRQEFE